MLRNTLRLNPSRFFSTSPINKTRHLAQLKATATQTMKQRYPGILSKQFNGDLFAFTLRHESPAEVMEAGGLYPNIKTLSLSNTGSGENTGAVCFSLLPEVAAIFYPYTSQRSNTRQVFLYAFQLTGEFLLPGGQWRQIISPGACPLPQLWRARAMFRIDNNSRIHLGPIQGEGLLSQDHPANASRHLADFLHQTQNRLILPKNITLGEDAPAIYDIQDSDMSAQFQEEVEKHYETKPISSCKP